MKVGYIIKYSYLSGENNDTLLAGTIKDESDARVFNFIEHQRASLFLHTLDIIGRGINRTDFNALVKSLLLGKDKFDKVVESFGNYEPRISVHNLCGINDLAILFYIEE